MKNERVFKTAAFLIGTAHSMVYRRLVLRRSGDANRVLVALAKASAELGKLKEAYKPKKGKRK